MKSARASACVTDPIVSDRSADGVADFVLNGKGLGQGRILEGRTAALNRRSLLIPSALLILSAAICIAALFASATPGFEHIAGILGHRPPLAASLVVAGLFLVGGHSGGLLKVAIPIAGAGIALLLGH